jgi:hypothetical protein
LPATRTNAINNVAGSHTRLNRSSNRRSGSAAAQQCSLVCIPDTRWNEPVPGSSSAAPPFGGASFGITTPHCIQPLSPFPNVTGFPGLGVLLLLRPTHDHQSTVDLSRLRRQVAVDGWDDHGLCPCGLAVPTPQTFSTASPRLGFTNPEKFPNLSGWGRATPGPDPPGSSRSSVERLYTISSSRTPLDPCLPDPTPSGSTDAPRLCWGCSHPHRHLPARTAPSFGRLLRQPTGAGLSPHSNSSASRRTKQALNALAIHFPGRLPI